MKHLTKHIVAQYIIGIVFLISGVSKAINFPHTASIIHDYFGSYSVQLIPVLYDIFGAVLIGIELVISLFLLFNIQKKYTLNITILILLLFTFITLFIAIDGKISDCGCFGEQFSFTGWQSYAKNVILLVISFVAKQGGKKREESENYWGIIPVLLGVVCLCLLGLNGQPIYESGVFKLGKDVCMPPKDISQPVWSIERLVLNEDNNLIYVNISDTLFCQNKYTVLGIIRNYNEASPSEISKLTHSVLSICEEIKGYPVLLTSSIKNGYGLEEPIPIGRSDRSLLEKVISTNIGIVVIKRCTIIKKWQRNYLGWQEFPKSIHDI